MADTVLDTRNNSEPNRFCPNWRFSFCTTYPLLNVMSLERCQEMNSATLLPVCLKANELWIFLKAGLFSKIQKSGFWKSCLPTCFKESLDSRRSWQLPLLALVGQLNLNYHGHCGMQTHLLHWHCPRLWVVMGLNWLPLCSCHMPKAVALLVCVWKPAGPVKPTVKGCQ